MTDQMKSFYSGVRFWSFLIANELVLKFCADRNLRVDKHHFEMHYRNCIRTETRWFVRWVQ